MTEEYAGQRFYFNIGDRGPLLLRKKAYLLLRKTDIIFYLLGRAVYDRFDLAVR